MKGARRDPRPRLAEAAVYSAFLNFKCRDRKESDAKVRAKYFTRTLPRRFNGASFRDSARRETRSVCS